MKAVLVVEMKEGYLALPYSGNLAGLDPTNGRAVERAGYDNAGIGKAVVAILRDITDMPLAPEAKDDLPC